MDKNTCITVLNICITVLIISIFALSRNFNTLWLIILYFFVGTADSDKNYDNYDN